MVNQNPSKLPVSKLFLYLEPRIGSYWNAFYFCINLSWITTKITVLMDFDFPLTLSSKMSMSMPMSIFQNSKSQCQCQCQCQFFRDSQNQCQCQCQYLQKSQCQWLFQYYCSSLGHAIFWQVKDKQSFCISSVWRKLFVSILFGRR